MSDTPIGDQVSELAKTAQAHGQLIERLTLLEHLEQLFDTAPKSALPGLKLALKLLMDRGTK